MRMPVALLVDQVSWMLESLLTWIECGWVGPPTSGSMATVTSSMLGVLPDAVVVWATPAVVVLAGAAVVVVPAAAAVVVVPAGAAVVVVPAAAAVVVVPAGADVVVATGGAVVVVEMSKSPPAAPLL